MIDKLKRLLLHKTSYHNKDQDHTLKKKKKRFSLLLKTAMVDPHEEDKTKLQKLSKSTSFLQLSSLTTAPLKRTRSMFGQLCSSTLVVTAPTNQTSAILDYYASSVTATENSILHTAAVSISSAYGTVNSRYTPNISNNNYLQLGIQYYEKEELEQASHYWRQAAVSECPLGIFFYGLALRHGWGCRKSPALALRYLQKAAAEYSVYDLQSDLTRSCNVDKIESLVLLIYELGEFFWHGWEVPKNMIIASYYFQVASNMGNTDAMNDLAFCYKHGHGLEKDDLKAAQLYRIAENRGNGLVNNEWIWEEQYN